MTFREMIAQYTRIFGVGTTQGTVRCAVCGTEMKRNALAKASHGKKHVAAGEAIAITVDGPEGDITEYVVPR